MCLCEACNIKTAQHVHHKLSKGYKKHYGQLVHRRENLQCLCADCHLSKKPGVIIWNEIQFCKALKIKPMTKSGMLIWNRTIK